MRVLRLVLVISLLFIGKLFSVSYQEKFLQANELYKEGNFEKALSLYEEIPNKGAVILYNLGNCAYKMGNKGLALAYWRKAEKQWGLLGKDELKYNIYLVKKEFLKNDANTFVILVENFKNNFISFVKNIPLLVLQASFLVVWIFLFLYLKYLYKKKHKILIIILFLLIAIFGTLLTIRYSLKLIRYGVVIGQEVPVLSGPSESFSELTKLPEALEVIIKKKSDEYYKIKFAERFGWIKAKDIVEI